MNSKVSPSVLVKPEHLAHPKYRPDIDGLRAIAILLVVSFHAFPTLIKGGFAGVDVFFVISGFLISTIIFESLDSNSFSFSEFYIRRVKRIFPALLIVLTSCFVVGWFTLLADEYKQLGKHVASGAGFISNFTLWNESGYFDNAAEKKPLLHLWSLGIEEQFYIVWPLLMWAAWKKKFNACTIVVIVAVTSFFYNVKNIGVDAVSTFYSPQTRFWELLIGSFIAWLGLYQKDYLVGGKRKINNVLETLVYAKSYKPETSTLHNLQALLGLSLLIISVILITKEQLFPGWWALLPTLGTALLISAGTSAWVNRNILANRLLIWFGLISFPLYLWHWPLLVFARIIKGDTPTSSETAGVVALSITLAWLTYKFIEKPIRFGGSSKVKPFILLIAMFVIGVVGFSIYSLNGLSFRFPKIIQELTQFSYTYGEDFREGTCFLRPEQESKEFNSCVTPVDPNKKTILLWGDSHAAHLYRGYQQRFDSEFNLIQRTASSCPPILNVEFGNRPHCKKINDDVLELIATNKPDLVVLGGLWGVYNWTELQNTIDKLKNIGVTHVDVIGPVPRWQDDLPKLLFQYFSQDPQHKVPERMLFGFNKDIITLDSQMADMSKRLEVNYISPYAIMCDANGCLTRLGDTGDALTAGDVGHLTRKSSQYLVAKFPGPNLMSPTH